MGAWLAIEKGKIPILESTSHLQPGHLLIDCTGNNNPSSRAEGELRFPKPRFPRLSQFPLLHSYFVFEPPFVPIFSSQLECIHSGVRGSVPRNFKDPSLDNQGDHLGEYRERERRAIGRAITGGRGCGSPIAPRGEAAPNEAEAVYAVQPLGTPALRTRHENPHAPE